MYFFFFNDTATTEIYTLSLHDALPIYMGSFGRSLPDFVDTNTGPAVTSISYAVTGGPLGGTTYTTPFYGTRSEEHTSELQSRLHLVCRLLLEKKKNI